MPWKTTGTEHEDLTSPKIPGFAILDAVGIVSGMGKTSLDDDEYLRTASIVQAFLRKNGHITNRGLRSLTGLSYDQAIKFFNRALSEDVLERRGRASGTNYVVKSACQN